MILSLQYDLLIHASWLITTGLPSSGKLWRKITPQLENCAYHTISIVLRFRYAPDIPYGSPLKMTLLGIRY